MSRIGNKPITVPAGVEVKLDGQNISVKGPKGTLEREIHKNMKVTLDGAVITVERPDNNKENRSLHGLIRTLISNMIQGVTEEFTRKLEVNGVGYRAQKQGKKLVLTLGYSHPVEMEEPEGITFEVPNPTALIFPFSSTFTIDLSLLSKVTLALAFPILVKSYFIAYSWPKYK